MVDAEDVTTKAAAAGAGQPMAKRPFRKFTYRGLGLDEILDMFVKDIIEHLPARARRRFSRGLKMKHLRLIRSLRVARQAAAPGEKPACVRTHLRDMIIVPEMIGSQISVQWEMLQPDRDQAWDDGPLPCRILLQLQARQAWKAWDRRYPLLEVHSSQVKRILQNSSTSSVTPVLVGIGRD